MNDSSTTPPRARGVSVTTLILSVALAIAATAAGVLAALYVLALARPSSAGAPGQPSPLAVQTGSAVTPNVQKDTVKPLGKASGEVFYEAPFAAPPHLTLSAPHRVYRIAKQDEFGFTWEADSLAEDFIGDVKDVAEAIKNGTVSQLPLKKNIEYEDFTYEAKGVTAGPGVEFLRPFEQTGSFQSVVGTQGQVSFPIPYASPPNVVLSTNTKTTVLVEATETGFKWKNAGTDAFFNNGAVQWTAKGIRATKLLK
jgi:hypothetical protein